jgi:hypothetical protein
MSKLALTGFVGTLPNIMGKGLIISLGSVQACPNGLAWCLTQHIQQGLDHSVGWMSKLALMGLLGAVSNILGKGLMIMLGASTSLPSTLHKHDVQGLDDSVGCITKLALMCLRNALPNIMGKGLIILEYKL